MATDVSALVPACDMLGLPMPARIAQALMALTLALHWAFLAMTAGGAAVYLRPRAPGDRPLRRALAAFVPLGLQTAMTLGIAPLLFVQVLYGPFYYTANILAGYVWLGLLPVMVANFYLLYYGWYRLAGGRPVRWVGAASLLLLAAAALVLASNATLLQDPAAWPAFRAAGGLVPYLSDATFRPRWLMALAALAAGGGLFVALVARAKGDGVWQAAAGPAGRPAASGLTAAAAGPAGRLTAAGLTAAAAGLAVLLAAGAWAAATLPPATRAALWSGPEAPPAYAAAGAFAFALGLVILARVRPGRAPLAGAAAAVFLGLLALAIVRDTLRRIALAPYFDPATARVVPQWSSFALFAAVFVLGLALVGYMVRLALRPSAAAPPGEAA